MYTSRHLSASNSMCLSGSIFGKSILNDNSNLARSSTNENSRAISGNEIVQNDLVVEEHQQSSNIDGRENTQSNPDPDEQVVVVVMSADSLMNKYPIICEICNKGFKRDQNLQLHRRSHKLPYILKKKSQIDNKKKVYVCPVSTCLCHEQSNALADFAGMKKHFLRKHCVKTYECLKCNKAYAVRSDMRAHMINCGTKDYKCDCGLLFERLKEYNSHRKLCEVALSAESVRASTNYQQLETSSPENSTNYKTINHSLGNIADIPLMPPFSPIHHHQQNTIPLQGFPSINNYHQQVTAVGYAQGYKPLENGSINTGKSVGFLPFPSRDIAINYPFSREPHQTMTTKPRINEFHIIKGDQSKGVGASHVLEPQLNVDWHDIYMMSQPSLQNYNLVGTSSSTNMMDGTSVENFMGSTMRPHQMRGGDYKEFLGEGMNVYGEGREWVPMKNRTDLVNGRQLDDIVGGPTTSTSTSKMPYNSQGMKLQE